jgi:hypothetical protein
MNEVRRTVNAPSARAIVSAIGARGADRGAGTDRAVVVVALLLLLAALAATIFRLRLGLNFNDEPFYVALPYRFLMGDRMFIDELNYLQFSSVLTYPVVAAWVYFFGNEGIVLAMRVAYFVFASAVGLSAFLALKSRLARPLAIIAAAVIPAFIPWGIPAPSYNTVGAGFLTISLFTAYLSRSSDRSWLALIAGVAQGAATTAYPPLIVGSVGLFAAALMRGDRTRWRVLGFYAIGVGLVLLPAAAAGGHRVRAVGDHENLGNPGIAGGDHGGDGPGFGAGAFGVGHVFHVAAGIDGTRDGAQGGPDLEAGIGGISVFAHGGGGGKQGHGTSGFGCPSLGCGAQ